MTPLRSAGLCCSIPLRLKHWDFDCWCFLFWELSKKKNKDTTLLWVNILAVCFSQRLPASFYCALLFVYFFLDLTSTVTSISLKTNKNVDFNDKRSLDTQNLSKWYSIQSYGHRALVFYEKDVSNIDSNTNTYRKTPKR